MQNRPSNPQSRQALRFVWRLGVLLALAVGVLISQEQVPAAEELPEQFKSVFVDDPAFGKDPFFPRSQRRQVVVTNETVTVPVPSQGLKLKGLSGPKHRRLAIINNYTFAEGEEYEIKLNGRGVNVRCLKISQTGVTVTVGGITRELKLKTDL